MATVVPLNGHRRHFPPFLDATAMVAEPEQDREWVIPGLLERQGRILLAGGEGIGKSLLLLTGAVQAAAGLRVFDRFEMDLPATTIYLDLEMARASTRRRLRQLCISAKLEDKALYVLHRPDGLDLASGREQRDLYALLDLLQPDLIVIDPLYKLMLTDSVYERDVRPTIKALDEMRMRYNCGLVLLHHLRKRAHGEASRGKDSSDIFGSSVLLRWPETIMQLNEASLRVTKDRDDTFGAVKSFPIKRGGLWPISLDEPGAPPDAAVLEVLTTDGPMTRAAVVKVVHRRTADVGEALLRLEAAQKVRHIDGYWEAVS